MTLLALDNLTMMRGDCPVVDHVSLTLRAGECVGLIGPNGAGKTSLMRAALGLVPAAGRSSLAVLPPAQRAARAAWLPQSREIAWPVSVAHLVALGALARGRAEDHPAVAAAIARLDLGGFAGRTATALSGGEQARVLLARALAQDTPLLMADEPLAGLDPAQAIRTMTLLAELAAEGRGVLTSLHDLGLAARHCTRLVVMHRGRLVADGAPAEVLTDDLLAEVFGIRCQRLALPGGGLALLATGTVTG